MEFAPKSEGERAGLLVLMSPAFHYDLCEAAEGGGLFVELVKRVGDVREVANRVPVSAGPLMLRIESDPLRYHFAFAAQDGIWHEMGTGEVNLLAPELANVWTGMYIGMFSASSHANATPADFDWFDYHPEDREKR
jgi:alpha-N-arabinofuranosidase